MVSVIITYYNYEKYVWNAIASCYGQCDEIIVVDDCSPVPVGDSDGNITIIRHKKNLGYSAAKNTGIKASKGDFIVMLDADDMLCSNSVAPRLKYLEKHKDVLMVHALAYSIKGDEGFGYWERRRTKLNKQLSMREGRKPHAQTWMLRREIHTLFGLYDENLLSKSDNEFYNRVVNNGGKTAKIFEPVAYYRKHSNQMHKWRTRHPKENERRQRLCDEAKEMRIGDPFWGGIKKL